MRRRNQKNPLLMRIIGISVLAHIIILPILAQFGAFKKIQQSFAGPPIVFVAPPTDKEKPEQKKEVHKSQKTQSVAKKSAASAQHQHQANRAHYTAPPVLAGPSTGTTDNGAGSIDNTGTGKVGDVVKADTNIKPPVDNAVKQNDVPVIAKNNEPIIKPIDTQPVKPVVKPIVNPVVQPVVQPVVKDPIFTSAGLSQSQQPSISIPDDMRYDALDKSCVVEVMVGTDGAALDARVTQSSNVSELDKRALNAARSWKFKPATRDGQPVAGRVRLHIEFQVS